MFLSRNKKNIDTFWLKKAPYQELWLSNNNYSIKAFTTLCSIGIFYDRHRVVEILNFITFPQTSKWSKSACLIKTDTPKN